MSDFNVAIVTPSQDGFAQELSAGLLQALPGARPPGAVPADLWYDPAPHPQRARPRSGLTAGLFAPLHLPPSERAAHLDLARRFDLVLTMTEPDAALLRAEGIEAVLLPQWPLAARCRIGLSAGAALPPELAALPGVDWVALGATDDLARRIDALLYPGDETGLPGLALRALSQNLPLIAPRDGAMGGWLAGKAAAHFEAGDPLDMARAVGSYLAAHEAEHAAARALCVTAHHTAFQAVLARSAEAAPQEGGSAAADPARHPAAPRSALSPEPVRLLIHGPEASAQTTGGPSLRVPATAAALARAGLPAVADGYRPGMEIPEDIVHLFNVWDPYSALSALRALKAAGKRVVFSPIYLEFSERDFWEFELPALSFDSPDWIAALTKARTRAEAHAKGRGWAHEPIAGFRSMLREMIALADHLVFLSRSEREALADLGAVVEDSRASLMQNAIEPALWAPADPALFREAYLGAGEAYVMNMGRIEPRKNQLMLARAMRGLPLKLVVIGKAAHPGYAERLRAEAGAQLLHIPRLEHGSEMMRSALAGAAAFALPSWSEGASMAALEAGAMGAPLLLSDRSSEREYFGDLVDYADPGDPEALRAALLRILEHPDAAARSEALRIHVRQSYDLTDHAAQLAQAYATLRPRQSPAADLTSQAATEPRSGDLSARLIGSPAEASAPPTPASSAALQLGASPQDLGGAGLVLDVTGLASGASIAPEDIASRLALALVQSLGHRARLIAHHPDKGGFLAVSAQDFAPLGAAPLPSAQERLCVLGPAALRNRPHLEALADLRASCGCGLIFLLSEPHLPAEPERAALATLAEAVLLPKGPLCAPLTEALAALGPPGPEVIALAPWLPAPLLVLAPERAEKALTKTAEDPSEGASPDISGAPPEALSASVQCESPAPKAASSQRMPNVLPPDPRLEPGRFVFVPAGPRASEAPDLLGRIWRGLIEGGRVEIPTLVLTGTPDAECGPILHRLAMDPVLGPYMVFLPPQSAEQRLWLLEHACLLLSLNPESRAGLEARLHGKACLTPDAPLKGATSALLDAADWTRRLEAHLAWPSLNLAKAAPEGEALSPEALREILLAPRRAVSPPKLPSGRWLQGALDGLEFQMGWHPASGATRLACAAQSRLRVDARGLSAQTRQSGAHFLLALRIGLPRQGFGGQSLSLWSAGERLWSGEPQVEELLLRVPSACLDAGGWLTLDLHYPLMPDPDLGQMRGVELVALGLVEPAFDNPLTLLTPAERWITSERPARIDTATPEAREILGADLSWVPGWGIGAQAGVFELALPVVPGARFPTLTLEGRAIATEEAPLRLRVLLNGQEIGRTTRQDDLPFELDCALDPALWARSAPALLRIETENRATPLDLRLGQTAALAGLGVLGVSLHPAPRGADAPPPAPETAPQERA